MTPATLAHRVAHTIWTTRRGVGVLVGLLMAIIGLLLYAVLTASPAQVVEYGATIIAPERGEYCPGEIMRYPVQVSVGASDLPVIWRITEAWQRDSGVIVTETARSWELPIVRPLDVQATATRTVPALAPGMYWLNHVAQNGETTAYTVGPVTVRNCP